jgi:catechol 2,3-dioxygenase-like lactoylglutathione lyase family enzyme
VAHNVEGLNHHGITVTDLDQSLEFFAGVLGFEAHPVIELDRTFVSGVTGVSDATIRVAFVEGPEITVELLQYTGPANRQVLRPRPCDVGSAHLALFVRDIAAIVEVSAAIGWSLAGAIQPITTGPRAGGRAAYLHDRDGITVELVERPRAPLGLRPEKSA